MQNNTRPVHLPIDFSHVFKTHPPTVYCPTQFLAIDHANGNAHTLIDMVSQLFGARMSYTLATHSREVKDALTNDDFSLVLLGIDDLDPDLLHAVHSLRAEHPMLPVVVVASCISQFDRDLCAQFGLSEIMDLPPNAATLKAWIRDLAKRYIDCGR